MPDLGKRKIDGYPRTPPLSFPAENAGSILVTRSRSKAQVNPVSVGAETVHRGRSAEVACHLRAKRTAITERASSFTLVT